jgi:fatty acid desaturase
MSGMYNEGHATSPSAVIGKDELKRLTVTSDARAWWTVFVNYALVAAALALAALWRNPWAWAVASVLLAGRSQGLAVLAHDAGHLAFFSSRALNEWAGKWLFGALPNLAFTGYRKGHLEHHRTLGTARDPDFAFVEGYPANRASMARKFLRDLSGVNGVKNIVFQIRGCSLDANLPFVVAHAVLFAVLWACGVPEVYACWWLGQVFVFPLLVRLRVMSEHGAARNAMSPDPRESAGTTLSGPLARLLVTPNHVNYHVEHHLAAAVPPYRLAELHRTLVARGYYDGVACVAPSLWAVVRRCTARDSAGAARRSGTGKRRGIFDNMR